MHEPRWNHRDREAAIEWSTEQAMVCDGCGHPVDETIGEGALEYDARSVRCTACEAIQTTSRIAAGIDETDPTAGMRWQVVPREG